LVWFHCRIELLMFGVAQDAGGGNKVPPSFSVVISANASNINLRTVANAAGYTGGNCTITINAGVEIFSTSTATAAVVPGVWPAGVTVTLINKGIISGAGGLGGGPGLYGYGGGAGNPGGPALNAAGISGYTFKVDNTLGIIRGGGGGGGQGGYYQIGVCGVDIYGGGGGGGGQGHNGGAGGPGGGSNGDGGPGNPGGTGTPAAPGNGGNGAVSPTFGTGATGGNWGTVGGTGQQGFVECTTPQPGGAGGLPGNSVTGNANINWLGFGTRTGPIA
jgi:hypothetical protein